MKKIDIKGNSTVAIVIAVVVVLVIIAVGYYYYGKSVTLPIGPTGETSDQAQVPNAASSSDTLPATDSGETTPAPATE